MRQKSVPTREPAEEVIKGIRRASRRHFSAEDKIRIVLEGLRGEASIAELCRREGDYREPLLSLVEGISRSREEATGWRYRPGGRHRMRSRSCGVRPAR